MIENKYIAFILLLLAITTSLNAQFDVSCVGNSITLGYRSTNPYPDQLKTLLDTNYIVTNYGHASTTILKKGQGPYWDVPEHYFAIGNPRDIVVITFGTNATRAVNWDQHSNDFEDDYLALINEFKQWNNDYHQTKFIIGLPPPIYTDTNSWGVRNDVLINEVIPKIKNIANQADATLVDFYTPMLNHPEWFDADEIHPNATGDSVIAKIVYDAIQQSIHPAPDTPTGLIAIPQLYSIDLKWNANQENDIYQYRVFRADSENGYQNIIGQVLAPNTTFSDNSVIPDQIYYYSIDAVNTRGKSSDRSGIIPAKTYDLVPPAAPNNLTVALEADSIKLNWEPNTENDLSKYYLFRNTDQNELQDAGNIIGTIYPPLSSYIDFDYISAETYYYGVKAQDITGNISTLSNVVNVTARSRPVSNDTTVIAYEDQKLLFSSADFPFEDADGDTLEQLIFIDSDEWNYFLYDNNSIDSSFICEELSKLSFQSPSNMHGLEYAFLKYKVIDSFGSTSLDTNIMVINVLPVNDEPTLDPLDDLSVIEDTHDISIQVSGISAGQIDEIQELSIELIPPDAALFNPSRIQYTSPDSNGIVIIDPKESVSGTQLITIRIWDDGGTDNNGVNYTDQLFHLYITPRNDPPIFDLKPITITEDIDTIITITGIKAGPWENNQNISISVKSDNTDILPDPILTYFSPDNFATLTFSTIPNINGTTALTLFMSDDGGTELGGIDSETYTIPVEILAINDKPSRFGIITPSHDSTLIITKYNFNDSFIINWEESEDIENDAITYDIIFEKGLSELSRHGLSETSYGFTLKDILSVTDTVNIATDSYTVSASDGELQTTAQNNGLKLSIDGRAFAPAKLNLDQNFPNPFNHSTKIGFDLPKKSVITLSIFDLLGEEIVRLVDNKAYLRGYNTVTWNGLDENYQHVPAGVYIVQIKMQNEVRHKKLLLLK